MVYNEDAYNKKATSITIVFLSSDALKPEVKTIYGDAGAFKGYYDTKHEGNVLMIDNVRFVYK